MPNLQLPFIDHFKPVIGHTTFCHRFTTKIRSIRGPHTTFTLCLSDSVDPKSTQAQNRKVKSQILRYCLNQKKAFRSEGFLVLRHHCPFTLKGIIEAKQYIGLQIVLNRVKCGRGITVQGKVQGLLPVVPQPKFKTETNTVP